MSIPVDLRPVAITDILLAMRLSRLLLCLGAVAMSLPSMARGSEAVQYVLGPASTVSQVCLECPAPAGRPEPLTGTFSLTPLPLTRGERIEALTDVAWESRSYHVTGSGFVQFLRAGQVGMVLRARVNGEDVELRATRRQMAANGGLTVVLGTPRGKGVGYLIVLIAYPATASAEDPKVTAPQQSDACAGGENGDAADDADQDGVAGSCDACPDTPAGDLVNHRGCSVEQLCPCEGPAGGGIWKKGAYGRCVARAVREFRRQGLFSRSEAVEILRRALRSGCGQTVVALAGF